MLLLVNVSDLEPNVGMGERIRRVLENLIKTPQAVAVLALLLVNYAKAEEDLVGFVEIFEGLMSNDKYTQDVSPEGKSIPVSILRTDEKAASAWSKEPYRTYSMPIPYHNLWYTWA